MDTGSKILITAEERVAHLNRVLRSIRNVNQLIARQSGDDRLMQRICDSLIETRGYYNAWIALFGDAGELVTTAAAGMSNDFPALFERLAAGETVHCMPLALAQEGVQVVPDPAATCANCPLAAEYAGQTGLAVPLRHGHAAYGLLVVSIPYQFALEEEEHALLEEVAGDIALALHDIEVEKGRRQVEEALRSSEERFATVMNSLHALMYVADMETYELLFVNQHTRDIFGAREGQICWQVLQAGQTGPCDFCTNKYLVEDGQPTGLYTWEFQNTVNKRWFHIQDQAIRWVDGRLVRMEVATDVTALKETEKALQRQVAELDAFSHTVAHGLKNPLSLITAYGDLLLEEIQEDALENESLVQYARIIQQTGLKMDAIIDELLLLASVRAVAEVDLQALDMAAIVANAMRRLSDMIAERQAEVSVPDTWPAVQGHALWIEEVWVNYISNALKYGGHPPRIELGAMVDGPGYIRFWVRDNGPGLSREEQARLFTQFTRLHHVHADGHGLGLSIVRRIMDKLGGKAGVESGAGRGSEFFFILPDFRMTMTIDGVTRDLG